jgi:multiple sugar transport system substrate-binding protein
VSRDVVLRGITWDHDRGLRPLVATAAAYAEHTPNVRVEWDVRSLQAFADEAVDALAARFDLIVLDHPAVGFAVDRGCLVPLDDHLDPAFLDDQAQSSVGRSYQSYVWQDHVWALAVDAAAEVASFRPDLLERLGVGVPSTWAEVFELEGVARAAGMWIALPMIPVDAVLASFAVCVANGIEPFGGDRRRRADVLDTLDGLVARSHRTSLGSNPPRTYERMASSDDVVYCPLGFGYSNYGRPGYREHRLGFAPAPAGTAGARVGTLGGAGLAVSASSPNVGVAVAYAAFVASPDVQRGVYVREDGQPGHRSAWLDDEANELTGGYFRATLPGLDVAYLRPRHVGFLEFQDRAGELVHRFLTDRRGNALDVVDRLDEIFAETRGSSDT